jgi:WD40 repeat protein
LSSEYLIDDLQVRITARSSTSSEITMIDNMSIQNMPARPPPPVMPPAYSIYVADTDDREILAYSEDSTYLGNLVTSRSGGLGKVWSVAFGPDGHLYASDSTHSKIRKYNGFTGAPISSSSGWASTNAEPYGITWNGNTLYVATSDGIERFSASGVSLGYFGDAFRTLSSELLTPYDMAFCSDGRMYVADRSAGKAFYYGATDGAYLGEIPNVGPLNTHRASGIACGPAIYGSGESLYQSGDDGGRINEISLSTRTLVREITTLVDEPYGMGMDNAGNLYISNKDDDNILKISSNGAVSVFASGFDDPHDVTVGPEYSAGARGSAGGLAEGGGDTQQQQESNDSPEIRLIYNGTTVYEPVSISSKVTFEVQATDSEGDAITIGIIPDGIPEDAISVTDNGDGTAAISINPENMPIGTHVFWVTASDVDNYDREPYAVRIHE